jgi:hypothetical protein
MQSDPAVPVSAVPRVGGEVVGVARAIQFRQDAAHNRDVLSFRVDRYDGGGNRLDPVPVELRGSDIAGQLSEGEEVAVSGRWDHGTLVAREVVNRSTHAELRRRGRAGRRGVLVAVGAFVAAVIAVVVVVLAVRGGSGGSRTVPAVVGLDTGQARQRLFAAGFTLDRQALRGNEFCRVVAVEPPAGRSVGKSTVVTLVAGPSGNDPPGCR